MKLFFYVVFFLYSQVQTRKGSIRAVNQYTFGRSNWLSQTQSLQLNMICLTTKYISNFLDAVTLQILLELTICLLILKKPPTIC